MTIPYSLNRQDEAFVQTQIASGRYRNAAEILHDTLQLLQEREHQFPN